MPNNDIVMLFNKINVFSYCQSLNYAIAFRYFIIIWITIKAQNFKFEKEKKSWWAILVRKNLFTIYFNIRNLIDVNYFFGLLQYNIIINRIEVVR